MANDGAEVKTGIITEPVLSKSETPESLLAEVDRLSDAFRAVIVRCKLLDKSDAGLAPYQSSKRALGLAQEHLQTGMLWLRKCITRDVRF